MSFFLNNKYVQENPFQKVVGRMSTILYLQMRIRILPILFYEQAWEQNFVCGIDEKDNFQ